MRSSSLVVLCSLVLLSAPNVAAQVQTGSIVGVVTDTSSAVMPGVLVSLSGDRLIGGPQSFTTDASGCVSVRSPPPW